MELKNKNMLNVVSVNIPILLSFVFREIATLKIKKLNINPMKISIDILSQLHRAFHE